LFSIHGCPSQQWDYLREKFFSPLIQEALNHVQITGIGGEVARKKSPHQPGPLRAKWAGEYSEKALCPEQAAWKMNRAFMEGALPYSCFNSRS